MNEQHGSFICWRFFDSSLLVLEISDPYVLPPKEPIFLAWPCIATNDIYRPGGPCRNAGRLRPDGARYVYCARHSQRWARYETVGVEDLKPMPKEIPKEIPREIKKPKVSKSRARIASQDGPEARTSDLP